MDEEDPAELNHGVNGFSPPTKSHFDMARPRAEDPEYQEQIRLLVQNSNPQPTNQNNLMIANVISMAPQVRVFELLSIAIVGYKILNILSACTHVLYNIL